MKTLNYLLLVLTALLLSNCSSTLRPAYHGDEDYNEEYCQWELVNTGTQPLMVRIKESPRMHYMELKPGDRHLVRTDRESRVTILAKTWEEYGWSSDPLIAPIQRTARWSGTQQVRIDDLLLRNVVLHRDVVINNTPWTIIVTDDQGNSYGEIPPNHISWPQEVAPGPINFFWRKKGSDHTVRIKGLIDDDKNDVVVRDQLYDWKVSCRRQ
jgi:hypothetical protein